MPDVEREFDDVLAALRAVQPMGPSAEAAGRLEPSLPDAAPASPLRRAYDRHADEVLAYVAALLGEPWQAEQVLVEAFARHQPSDAPPLSQLLQHARHAALERLAKSQRTPRPDELAPADRALLLERRLRIPTRELCRTWSVVPAGLEERLLAAGHALLRQVGGPPDCEHATRLVRATVDLLDGSQAEAHGAHLATCTACAPLSEALEESSSMPDATLPAPDTTWKAVAAQAEPHEGPDAEALGIVVSVSCCFCHDRLRRTDAAFCATCLAPHHPDCFEAHSGCSTLGCPGQELVLPTSMIRRRRTGSWSRAAVVGLVALSGAVALTSALGGAVAAWTAAQDYSGSGAGSASVAPLAPDQAAAPRPIPASVALGCSREALVAAFGEPERAVWDSEAREWRLSWFGQGVKAILDGEDRLLLATYFGAAEWDPDAQPDANGNRIVRDGPYRSGGWSWRGVEVGASDAEAFRLLGGADEVTPDANGNTVASYDAEHVHVAIGVDHVVLAFYVGGDVVPDANGNVSVHADASLLEPSSQTLTAQAALTQVFQRGALDRVLGRRTFVGYDHDGRLTSAYELDVRSAADDSDGEPGLHVSFSSRDLRGVEPPLREEVRVSFDGRLLFVRQDATDQLKLEGREVRPGRMELQVTEFDSAPYTRVVFTDARSLSPMFATYVLSVLSHALGDAWQVLAQDPLEDRGELTLRGSTGTWQGRPVRTVALDRETRIHLDPGTGQIVQVWRPESTSFADGWIEPVGPDRYQELLDASGRGD